MTPQEQPRGGRKKKLRSVKWRESLDAMVERGEATYSPGTKKARFPAITLETGTKPVDLQAVVRRAKRS
jgi:hypothetical protein